MSRLVPSAGAVGIGTDLNGRPVLRYPPGSLTVGTYGEDTVQSVAGGVDWQPAPVSASSAARKLVSGSPFATQSDSFTCSLAYSPSGKLLATANNHPFSADTPRCGGSDGVGGGSVSVFAVDRSGALHPVRGSPFTIGQRFDTSSVAFSPSGTLLASANTQVLTSKSATRPVGSSVSVFSIGRSGALRAVHGSPFPNGKLVANSLAFSPSGKFIAFSNDSGTISMFSVSRSGALRPASRSPFATGVEHPATAIAFNPSGTLLATANADGTGSVLAVNAATGALTLASGYELDPRAFLPSAVAVSPRGGTLVAASSTSGSLAMFAVNDATGALTPAQGLPWMPDSAFSSWTESPGSAVAFDPGGRGLAVANLRGSVSTFSVR